MRNDCSMPPNSGAAPATQLAAREAQGLVALAATTPAAPTRAKRAPEPGPCGWLWRGSKVSVFETVELIKDGRLRE